MVVYHGVFKTLVDLINKAQYFNPIFSWVIVSFTYFSIGIQGGAIWKYLFYTSSAGFIATCCGMVYNVSNTLIVEKNIFVYLTWVEGIFWTLSEWGYVFINFVKIKTCISTLRKKRWKFIMGIILLYSLVVRTRLMYLDFDKRIQDMKNYRGKKIDLTQYNKSKDNAHALLYCPLGLVSALFIYYTIKEFISVKDDSTQNILSILLHSTLTRMSLVSLLFIGLSVIVHFPRGGWSGFIREFLWRVKGNLGLIFLVDILLLRIDLDNNQIAMQEQEIEQLQLKKDLNGIIPFNDKSSISPGYITPKLGSPMNEYAKAYKDNDEQSLTQITINPRNSVYSLSPSVHRHPSVQTFVSNANQTGINASGNKIMRNSTIGDIANVPFSLSPPPEKPMKSDKRKAAVPMIVTKPPESLSPNNTGRRKFSQPNIYSSDIPNASAKADRRYSVQSVVLGNKVYSKVSLEPSSSNAVSPSMSYSATKYSPTTPNVPEVEIVNLPSSQPTPAKKTPGNILIESDLLEDTIPIMSTPIVN